MTDIEWGADIAVNGVRPEWLRDEDKFSWYGCCYVGTSHDWHGVQSIRLTSNHPYYTAVSRGFTYWPGGESAPEDWDGGLVLTANGEDCPSWAIDDWKDRNPLYAIIGYHKRTEQPAPAIAQLTEADLAEARQAYFNSQEGDSAKFYATRWGLLAPDPDLTLAKSIVGDAEAIALAIKAARENGRG